MAVDRHRAKFYINNTNSYKDIEKIEGAWIG